MVDGAPPVGSIPGQHLHDTPEDAIWEVYNRQVSQDSQARYVGPQFWDSDQALASMVPGMYGAAAFGIDSGGMPGASLAWNAGGMSVHWTAATPCPWGSEAFEFGTGGRWADDLKRAADLLEVEPDPFGGSKTRPVILGALEELFGGRSAPGRHPRPLPMAVRAGGQGRWPRTGPNRVFQALRGGTDERFALAAGTQAIELVHDGNRVHAVRLRETRSGSERLVRARAAVVCADAMRTPQLLYASQVRPAALGRYLNEHVFLSAIVHPDLKSLGLTVDDVPPLRYGEWRAGAYWAPHSDARQPFHGQLTETYADPSCTADSYVLNLTGYTATELRAENRLEFRETETDKAGLPKIVVRFSRTAGDQARAEEGSAALTAMARAFGPFDPASQLEVLPAGSSLHWTGTVRMGESDDGTSVCDPGCRVWGFENLFVAGNGVVPTALLVNATLAGAVTAVRAGDSAARALAGAGDR
jgi:choline dehydrogenase-like flavoprotein